MTPVFIFDIGNVLIDFDLQGLQQKIADESGVPCGVVRDNWSNRNLLAVETGKLSGPLYFRRFLEFAPVPWDYEAWILAWMDVYSPNVLGQTLFTDLRSRGYPVCILSNLAEYNKEAIARKFPGLFGQATRSFLSYELGFHKPDPCIYLAVCQSLKVDPRDCVFLDDSADNVAGARRIGMRGYVFSTAGFTHIVQEIRGATEA
jgi:FMN phosphatase YigB (HAD superfamily)